MRILVFVIAAFAMAVTHAADRAYPVKPIRLLVPDPQGGLDASSEQVPAERGAGARSRDATVKLATSASFLAPAPCASSGSDPGGSPLSPCDAPRVRDATVRESDAAAVLLAQASIPREKYPTRPIRLLVPYPPGGGNDTMARAIGAKLTEAWHQQVIIDNRPGANGLVACELAMTAAPDGYTLLMANIGSHAINPALYKNIPYDAVKDFAPVSQLGSTANVLVVHPSTPAKNLQELIALAKAKPGQLTYGSNGVGSSQHLAGALFGSTFGVSLVHVPYKGTGPVMTDMVGGHITMSFANMLAALPQVRARRLNAIGVTSLKRSPALPDVPAIAETAPGFEATSWWGVVSTKSTPPDVVNALNREIVKGLNSADMKTFLSNMGVEPAGTTPQEFAAFIKSERVKWAKVVRESGARAD